ncbi:exodeoxyribonuclease VII large subunit [Aquihabitans sp. McL0605]|uniref:exodeoxyribonuclease VII large subunit n=1 Tax=Aquihabitans sp. McL0605 TaxID=3415671 RepID=UPI003CF340BB
MTDGALFDESVGRDPRGDTWTVPELSAHLARLLAGALPDDVWIEGQIRNLNRSANGHVYFQLAEPCPAGQQPKTQLAVTLLAPERMLVNAQIKRAGGGVRMEDGIEVRIQGRVRWYGPRGVLQIRMHGIDPAYTLGRLQADKDRTLAALATEGLLDRNGRLRVPLVPLRIGLVTSIGTAAHADVMSELTASGIGFTVRSVDARTQGADAAASITRALTILDRDGVDVVLLVRGGGARTDLAAFDTELMARAIAGLSVPVFTGIGHEVDRSIADEVAHTTHKTPTAAAAAIVNRVRAFLGDVDDRAAAIQRAVHRSLRVAGSRLDDRTGRVARSGGRALDRQQTALDLAGERTTRAARRALDAAAAGLEAPARAVGDRGRRATARAERHLDATAARIRAHDPQLALARGWSITTTDDGRLVRHLADAPPGTTLVTRVADGRVVSTVIDPPDPPQEPAP